MVIIQGQGGLLRGHCVEQSLCIATRWWSWWLMDTFSFHLCIRRSDDGYWMTIYEQRTFSYILYIEAVWGGQMCYYHPPLSYLSKVFKTRCFSSPSTFLLEKMFILAFPFLVSKVMHIHVYLFQVLGKEIRQAENQLPRISLVILCSSIMYKPGYTCNRAGNKFRKTCTMSK